MLNTTVISYNTSTSTLRPRVKNKIIHRFLIAPILALAAGAGGCVTAEKVPRPTADSTRPELHWMIQRGHSRTFETLPAGASINTHDPERILVILVARDPEGLKQLTFHGEGSYNCSGLPGGPYTIPPQLWVSAPDPADQVPVAMQLSSRFNSDGIRCDATHRANGVMVFGGRGENYLGGTTDAQLMIHVLP